MTAKGRGLQRPLFVAYFIPAETIQGAAEDRFRRVNGPYAAWAAIQARRLAAVSAAF